MKFAMVIFQVCVCMCMLQQSLMAKSIGFIGYKGPFYIILFLLGFYSTLSPFVCSLSLIPLSFLLFPKY